MALATLRKNTNACTGRRDGCGVGEGGTAVAVSAAGRRAGSSAGRHAGGIEMIAPNRENRSQTQDGRPLRWYKRR